jgi:hypothetical protein
LFLPAFVHLGGSPPRQSGVRRPVHMLLGRLSTPLSQAGVRPSQRPRPHRTRRLAAASPARLLAWPSVRPSARPWAQQSTRPASAAVELNWTFLEDTTTRPADGGSLVGSQNFYSQRTSHTDFIGNHSRVAR